MQAESLLGLLYDLLDRTKSPQADGFNAIFNNMDVFYVFKMNLPLFVSQNSPLKTLAMKLLHQFIRMRPIVDEESISLFFSKDASKNRVLPELSYAYEQFMRYHRRQVNSQDFGIGTNAVHYKKTTSPNVGLELAASNFESD